MTPSGRVQTFGFVWLVSGDDIRAAIAAVQAAPPDERDTRVDHIEVIGHNTIYVYHTTYDRWSTARRVGGKWVYDGGGFVVC